jgi:hypothetical protein
VIRPDGRLASRGFLLEVHSRSHPSSPRPADSGRAGVG